MRKADVKVGSVYTAKVSGRRVQVRLGTPHPHGGWFATNLSTGRLIQIRTAARLTDESAEREAFEARLRRIQQLRDRIAYRGLGPMED